LGWDYKRKLLDPDVNIWCKHSKTVPWKNIEELFNSIPSFPKKGRKRIDERKMKELLKNHKPKEVAKILGCSVGTVYNYRKRFSS
jgi:hypothetical protein